METEISPLALPSPTLRHVFRLRAELAAPLDISEEPAGRRRLIPFREGRFSGPEVSGALLTSTRSASRPGWRPPIPTSPG